MQKKKVILHELLQEFGHVIWLIHQIDLLYFDYLSKTSISRLQYDKQIFIQQEILNKAKIYEETLSEEKRAAAKVYIKMMERILERGDVFVQTEQTRVDGLLKGKLSNEKKRTMEERKNILQSFSHKDEL